MKIGFGGGCHWCTEAIFRSISGVDDVDQGWITALYPNDAFSEAIIVRFDEHLISEADLIDIHLHTHSCTSNHSMRRKYRSAVYCFDIEQQRRGLVALRARQSQFDNPIVTQALIFSDFRANKLHYQDYYHKNPDKPFCQNIITPKLEKLRRQFAEKLAR